jgi:hypothetical protein
MGKLGGISQLRLGESSPEKAGVGGTVFGTEGWEFKSLRACHICPPSLQKRDSGDSARLM